MGRTKGQSVVTKETRRLAHEKYLAHHDEALQTLLNTLKADDASWSEKVSAAKEINNRAFGQAPTHATMLLEDSRNDKPLIDQDAMMALSNDELNLYANLVRKIMTAGEETIEGNSENLSYLENLPEK